MKTREEIARFVEKQFNIDYDCPYEKGSYSHYGRQDVRYLLDFIFEEPPKKPEEFIRGGPWQEQK